VYTAIHFLAFFDPKVVITFQDLIFSQNGCQ